MPRPRLRARLSLLLPATALALALSALLWRADAMPDRPDRVLRAPGAGTLDRPPVRLLLAAPAPARSIPLAPVEQPGRGVWPLDPQPEVVRPFDPPASTWSAGHRGVDLRGRVGQEVRTALGGEVVYAARLAGRGVVVVSHGATRTTYEPVSARVHRGERVATGQVIGTLQWSGGHCLPVACLHWGLRRGETYLDPLDLVGGGPQPVRLYPA